MSSFAKVKMTFRKLDIFASSELLRYNDEPDNQTYTGACVSVILCLILGSCFYSVVLSTFDLSQIDVKPNITGDVDQKTTLEFQDFQMAIGLSHLNLNQNQQYFDIVVNEEQVNDQFINEKSIAKTKSIKSLTLEKCSREEWTSQDNKKGFNATEIGLLFDKIGLQNWLCLPKDYNLKLKGRYSSNIFNYIKVAVQKCTLDPENPLKTCASADKLTDFLTKYRQFQLNIYYINIILNPSEQVYLQHYFQDRQHFQFTTSNGVSADIYISNYEVSTDTSILPYVKAQVDKGILVPLLSRIVNFQISDQQYAKVFLRKSGIKVAYSRSYYKLDSMLSYIGGLFSFLVLFTFYMQWYDECSYEIDIGATLFKDDDAEQIPAHQFNFFLYLLYLSYQAVKDFLPQSLSSRITSKFPQARTLEQYFQCREQVVKQIDVKLLMKRVIFLQRALESTISQQKREELYKLQKWKLSQAVQSRSYYEIENNEMSGSSDNFNQPASKGLFAIQQTNNRQNDNQLNLKPPKTDQKNKKKYLQSTKKQKSAFSKRSAHSQQKQQQEMKQISDRIDLNQIYLDLQ